MHICRTQSVTHINFKFIFLPSYLQNLLWNTFVEHSLSIPSPPPQQTKFEAMCTYRSQQLVCMIQFSVSCDIPECICMLQGYYIVFSDHFVTFTFIELVSFACSRYARLWCLDGSRYVFKLISLNFEIHCPSLYTDHVSTWLWKWLRF